jgi:hypothetical protein
MTVDLNKDYSVTVTLVSGGPPFVVRGVVFERKTRKAVAEVSGEGRVLSAAQTRAVNQARAQFG